MAELITYVVELDTPEGVGVMEVPCTLGPEAAERRARVAAASIRFGGGDLDTIATRVVGTM